MWEGMPNGLGCRSVCLTEAVWTSESGKWSIAGVWLDVDCGLAPGMCIGLLDYWA